MDKIHYYASKTPDVGQIVFAKVKKISEISIECELVEYACAEAIMPLTELSKRRHTSIRGLTRIGKLEPTVVLRNDNGCIDLSKKKVDRDDLQKAEKRFYMTKKLLSAVHHYSEIKGTPLQDLLERIVYKYKNESLENTDATEDELEFLKQKFETENKFILRATFNAVYYGYEGVEELKKIFSTSEYPVKYLSAPTYSMELESTNEVDGCEKLMKELNRIKEELELKGGMFEIKNMPQITNKTTEDSLEEYNEDEEQENSEEDV